MSLAPVDILEEDAADLQFPKENDVIEINPSKYTNRTIQHYKVRHSHSDNLFNNNNCNSCQHTLIEPYIKCAECNQLFCLSCFAQGKETKFVHQNTHAYSIVHDNIKVFPTSNWSAKEEKQLLKFILTCGFANWDDIAKAIKTKSANECREHYLRYYFDGIFEKMLGLSSQPYFPHTIPYMYKMNSVEPPRHDLDSSNFKSMAGYRCARGEFDTPYDNSAESCVSNLDIQKSDDENMNKVFDELNCAIFKAYNHRLKERKRRYKIMREHGLLLASRTLSWLSKYSEALTPSNSSKTVSSGGRFVSFMQLTNGIAFDGLVESMQYAHDLKKYIFRLYELRKNGISTFYGGKMYHKLRAMRTSKTRDKRAEQYENTWEWKQLVPINSTANSNFTMSNNCIILNNPGIKRKSTPLEILGLPNYEKLTEDEKQLCSTVRLVPSSYLAFKTTLLTENAKSGYLRLADARRLIKIDVNKTRQMYDFLLKSGFINKPFS